MRYRKKDQTKFLEELRKTGNVLTACAKAKVPKTTVYRWRSQSPDFAREFNEAFQTGREYMCEISEGVLHTHIYNKNIRAAEFYLRHNSPYYAPKKPVEPEKKKGVLDNLADLLKTSLMKGKPKD